MDVQLILVPYDSGQRGARMGAGPEHLLAAGLEPHLGRSGDRSYCAIVEAPAEAWRAEVQTAFALQRALAVQVRQARAAGRFPLVLSGNCMAAVGVVGGLGGRTGVVWFDAHGDFNTPATTTSGFLDGMALATVTGRCWPELARSVHGFAPVPEEAALLLGVRDLDPLEAEVLSASTLRHLSPAQVRTDLAQALSVLVREVEAVYVHVDLDVLDPQEGTANEYAAPAGLRLDELKAALGEIGRALPVAAATLASYDPRYDNGERVCRAAFAIAASVLGTAR